LKEQDVVITPVFSRYQGTFELTFWLSSIYELMDFRVALLQFTGGFQRWCRPEFFWTYLILPESVENYQTDDEVQLDWGNTLSDVIHVDTINKHRRVVPLSLDPIWRLESFNDASTKYGGDQIADYKLTATFGYEINLPTYVVTSEHIDPSLTLSLSLGSTYSKYPLVSPYKVLQVIENSPAASQYFERNYTYYHIEDPIEERDNLVVEFSENSFPFPEKLVEWNHISSGELLYIDDDFIADPDNMVRRENIAIIDSYKKEYLPYIRRACSVISINDVKPSTFYSKCEIMKKPCICNLTQEEADQVMALVNTPVTLDSRQRKIYSGALNVIYAEKQDPASAFDTLKEIQENDPELYEEALEKAKDGVFPFDVPAHRGLENVENMTKRLVSDFTDGVQTQFPLSYIIDSENASGLLVYVNDVIMKQGVDYNLISGGSVIEFITAPERGSDIYIGGEFLVIKESNLAAIYEFTEADIENLEEPIEVNIPDIDRKENVILVSYIGKMELERDYDIDIPNNTATIYLKPKVGEIVQFFYYV
jgi:hypothetical protein